jgi:hypothetical protein
MQRPNRQKFGIDSAPLTPRILIGTPRLEFPASLRKQSFCANPNRDTLLLFSVVFVNGVFFVHSYRTRGGSEPGNRLQMRGNLHRLVRFQGME